MGWAPTPRQYQRDVNRPVDGEPGAAPTVESATTNQHPVDDLDRGADDDRLAGPARSAV